FDFASHHSFREAKHVGFSFTAQRFEHAIPPSIAETISGYDTGVWWAFLAPAGIPVQVKEKLAKDCAEAVHVPAVVELLRSLGATPVGSTPDQLADFILAEYEKWGPVIRRRASRRSSIGFSGEVDFRFAEENASTKHKAREPLLLFDAGLLDHLRPLHQLHLD